MLAIEVSNYSGASNKIKYKLYPIVVITLCDVLYKVIKNHLGNVVFYWSYKNASVSMLFV